MPKRLTRKRPSKHSLKNPPSEYGEFRGEKPHTEAELFQRIKQRDIAWHRYSRGRFPAPGYAWDFFERCVNWTLGEGAAEQFERAAENNRIIILGPQDSDFENANPARAFVWRLRNSKAVEFVENTGVRNAGIFVGKIGAKKAVEWIERVLPENAAELIKSYGPETCAAILNGPAYEKVIKLIDSYGFEVFREYVREFGPEAFKMLAREKNVKAIPQILKSIHRNRKKNSKRLKE